jgi:hypothetical protein
MNKLLPIIAAALLLPAAAAAHTATWASKDRHYLPTDSLPAALTADTTLQAWRGERIGALALMLGSPGRLCHNRQLPRLRRAPL